MVEIVNQFPEKDVDRLYIHITIKDDVITPDFFFSANGVLLERDKAISGSRDEKFMRQAQALSDLSSEVIKAVSLFKSEKRAVPEVIKIVFDVSKNSIQAEYQYDLGLRDEEYDNLSEAWYNALQG